MDGILGMAMGPHSARESRYFHTFSHAHGTGKPRSLARPFYFHSLASNTENVVSTEVLQNATMWMEDPDANPRLFKVC